MIRYDHQSYNIFTTFASMNTSIHLNGINISIRRVEISIDTPTIIFLHDSLGSTELWRDFPDQLCKATGCNMLIYERQGYGHSDPMAGPERTKGYMEQEADTLLLLIKTLNSQRPILFGHSDGASIALIFAGKYPGEVSAVIAEAGHLFVEDITLDGIKVAVEQYKTTNLRSRLEKYHGDNTDTLFRAWTETWLGKDFRDWNIEHFLPAIECPVLVIQGEKDEYGSLKQVEAVSSQVKGLTETCIIPDTGHTPHKEKPGIVLEASTKFISQYLSRSPL